jgi:hypothetical protein
MDSEKIREMIEIAQTILLSAVVLVTAWCGYQSARWSGITSFKLSSSQSMSIEATKKSLMAEKKFIVDAYITVNFVNAVIEDKQEVISFYLSHLRPEFGSVLNAWINTQPLENPDAPPHPIAMPAYNAIVQDYETEANVLRKEQELKFKEAYEAKYTSDDYTFKTVVLASVLFIGGVFPTFRSLKIRIALLGLDYTIALVAFSQLVKLPIA